MPIFNDLESYLKTLWEKEKLLVTTIFSFSHSAFYPYQNKFKMFSHVYEVAWKCFQLDLLFGKEFNVYHSLNVDLAV